jgi:hypothetical protein
MHLQVYIKRVHLRYVFFVFVFNTPATNNMQLLQRNWLLGVSAWRANTVNNNVKLVEKSFFNSARPYGATFQRRVIFVLAAVRTWNLTTVSLRYNVQTGPGAHRCPPPPHSEGTWVPLAGRGWGMNLTTDLLIMPRLKMNGAVPPLPHTYAWRGS